MLKQILKPILIIGFLIIPSLSKAATATPPVLNFSDIVTGPKTGNTDGVGGLSSSEHGAIVTVWGNNLGSTQGTSKIYFTDSAGQKFEAAHVYYWKNADGQLPGGPADLYSFHKMQEIAFSIPASAANGAGQIKVVVNGIESTTLPFEIRPGNIKFIRSSGNDITGDGSWDSPWATVEDTVTGGNNKLSAGDLVYSDGVGAENGVMVGSNSQLAGTAQDHISFFAYPNSRVTLTGNVATANPYTINYSGENPYWNWSKVSVNTVVSGFAVTRDNRLVGVEITGPSVYDGRIGAIGGNCGDVTDCTSPEGGEYLGIYIHNYGKDTGVTTAGHVGTTPPYASEDQKNTWDRFQHLYYISNRSGSPLNAYEIGWNYLADNPIYQGIYIYDKSSCGDWNGIMKIHHNVIENQRGSAISVDLTSCSPSPLVPFEIHDNLIIQDPDVSYSGQALQINAPIRAETPAINNRIYNNTIYGYVATNVFAAGNTEFENNIVVDRLNLPFFDNAPTSSANNLFYSTFGLTMPSWAGSGSIGSSDPNFENSGNNAFSLVSNSPAVRAGLDNTTAVAPMDLIGTARIPGNISIGAIQYLLPTYFRFYEPDFTELFSNWLYAGNNMISDVNSDKAINSRDLGLMMSKWH